jgi:nucleotidyltransferase/DNA polymerase involved in DNA repair
VTRPPLPYFHAGLGNLFDGVKTVEILDEWMALPGRGMTVIKGRDIAQYLNDLPVEKIWGIGLATTNYLAKLGIRTALAFAQLPEKTVRQKFTKPGVEIWQELRGDSVYPVTSEEKSSYASISKTKTFTSPPSDADYLFAQLMRNVESVCIKARRYALAPKKIEVFLKKQNFDSVGSEAGRNKTPSSGLPLIHVKT